MSISPVNGSLAETLSGTSSPTDKQSFGAQVVSSTLDTMNGQGGAGTEATSITDKASFGAAVVTKTLDYMNSGSSHGSELAQNYDFSKNILSSYTANTGGVTDVTI